MQTWLAAAALLLATNTAHAGCKIYANGPGDAWRHVDLKKVAPGLWLRVNLVLDEGDGSFGHQEIGIEVADGKVPDARPQRRGEATLTLRSGATVTARVHTGHDSTMGSMFTLRIDEADRDRILDDREVTFALPFEGETATVKVPGGAGKKLSKALACVKDHVPE